MKTYKRHTGLTDAEVLASRNQHGDNVLSRIKGISLWQLFISKFRDPLIIILLVIGILSVGVSFYEYYVLHEPVSVFFEPIGIYVAIMLATGLSFWFEMRANQEFNILNYENDHEQVKVLRNGTATLIDRCDVVVGDIVLLQSGDEVPADAEIFESVGLLVDESMLTGEPPHSKGADDEQTDSKSTTYPVNKLYRGTKVLEGTCRAEVFAVGDSTENGKIMLSLSDVAASKEKKARAQQLQQANKISDEVKTPLNEQLAKLGGLITKISYIIAAAVFVVRMIVYFHWHMPDASVLSSPESMSHMLTYLFQSIMISVTLVVVAVPEGLPMAVSLSLANSMRKMLRTNNLVRKLHACETMGATTVICTDKTGTLTQNRMQVRETMLEANADLIHECIAINSTAELEKSDSGVGIVGNPTEGALLAWLDTKGIDYADVRSRAAMTDTVPFSTERKYMATMAASPASGRRLLYVKGAPEIIINMCGDVAKKADYTEKLDQWQRRGMRTLALAYMVVGADADKITDRLMAEKSFRMLGIFGIEDPVRPDVAESVRRCIDAGIDIKIVTGDTKATAREIGRQIGLQTEDENIVDGSDFSQMTDGQLLGCVERIKIISRARPMDKRRLVAALQTRNHVVAVTGDGTNDAPALKQAHVGISMGSGTKVAKDVSDITILDNSFSSIVHAVEWGRGLYKNIQRFLLFQLTVNVSACLIVLFGAFMGTESPLTVTQLLWVNLIMDTFAAFALSALPPDDNVMQVPPRKRTAFILDNDMIANILGVGLFFFVLLVSLLYIFQHADIHSLSDMLTLRMGEKNSVSPYELTLLFTIFVMTHFWYIFNTRAYKSGGSGLNLRGCEGFIVIAAVIAIGQVVIVQVPVVNTFFNVVPLKTADWAVITVLSSAVMLAREVFSLAKSKIQTR